ncbi:MAG: MYG1 family protein [Chlamydiota bacterium]
MEPKTLGIHDGAFHADEVTAAALLLLFDQIDVKKIYRTRDPLILSTCEYVCDVGGVYDPQTKRFDHHQVSYKGVLSSAGMVLKYLKDIHILDTYLYDYFNRSLILGVDAHDNGLAKVEIGFCSFSQVISNFVPIEQTTSKKEMDSAFFEALQFVVRHLEKLLKRYHYTVSCREKVEEAMKKNQKFLEFQDPLPWMENFFLLGGEKHPALFVIMPAGEHWKLRGIPPNLKDRMKTRYPLPVEWAGLHDQELAKVCGIHGSIFCHKGRFISIWKTKKDAYTAMDLVLGKSRDS